MDSRLLIHLLKILINLYPAESELLINIEVTNRFFKPNLYIYALHFINMPALKIGDKAPVFTGKDQNGKPISLSQFKGKKLALYFYPKDNTPGCSTEACNLRDNYDNLLKKGYEVVGVSADSEKSHLNFIGKFNLPFPLIADEEKKIIRDYKAWGEKKMYGRAYEGILRKTYIISENGIIEKIIEKVKISDHTRQIFED
jgi:peroxiredoxin Q/BCP